MEDRPISPLENLDPALTSTTTVAERNDQVDKNEFITLLVTQLQNQDPLDPMANEEFAVQLAQFTQVEQLVAINEKLDASSGGSDFSSLASYLGHEVILDSNLVQVTANDGGQVTVDLSQDAEALAIELVDESGIVRETINVGAMTAGKQSVSLSGLTTANGEFFVQAKATGLDGAQFEPEAFISGVVSGFVPGPDPILLVGDREVSTSDVQQVRAV